MVQLSPLATGRHLVAIWGETRFFAVSEVIMKFGVLQIPAILQLAASAWDCPGKLASPSDYHDIPSTWSRSVDSKGCGTYARKRG